MLTALFGTDGIRGRVGHSPVSPEDVLKIGWAAGTALKVLGKGRQVVLGKDTRVSGYLFESLLQAGFIAAGVDTALTGPLPTPAIAHLTRTIRATAGVVISASHNPYYDNGIKFFQGDGHKFDDVLEQEIEKHFHQPMRTASDLGKATRMPDAAGRYIEFCKSTFPATRSLSGYSLVVDCANGACYDLAPRVFRELGADIHVIANEPDGYNINQDCGTESTAALVEAVIKHKANAGIAFDGDGDRLVMVDEAGNILDGDKILFLLARHRQQAGILAGGVVGTIMSNYGFEKSLERHGIDLYRTQVGDRHVLEELRSRGWCLGGEPSGHIVCFDKTTTGDGIVAALQVLNAMVSTDTVLSLLTGDLDDYPQARANVTLSLDRVGRSSVVSGARVQQMVSEVESLLGADGRVVVRCSGTEPVVRVMVEGSDGELVTRYCRQIAAAVAHE
ncbi:MAG: phosphoglucosamine mutase [Acidiferrobacteraceae bacterium]|nr:phosphoglucosamine mutase [Acidiferrobacteraceae bacterium]